MPQALGGVLFGAGFLAAGLCPGTSCVAAAAGRLDGLGVIAGMLIGVAAFNTVFRSLANFYTSTPLGAVTLTDLAGVSRGIGVAVVTLAALAGVRAGAAHRAERASKNLHAALAVVAGCSASRRGLRSAGRAAAPRNAAVTISRRPISPSASCEGTRCCVCRTCGRGRVRAVSHPVGEAVTLAALVVEPCRKRYHRRLLRRR